MSDHTTTDLMAKLPWLKRLPTQAELKQLKFEASWNAEAKQLLDTLVRELNQLGEEAKADDHVLFFPTDIAKRGDETLGYASIGALPMVNVWFHTQKVKGRDSATLMNMVEYAAKQRGFNTICVPCWKSSPLREAIEKWLGYSYFGETGLFVKTLR